MYIRDNQHDGTTYRTTGLFGQLKASSADFSGFTYICFFFSLFHIFPIYRWKYIVYLYSQVFCCPLKAIISSFTLKINTVFIMWSLNNMEKWWEPSSSFLVTRKTNLQEYHCHPSLSFQYFENLYMCLDCGSRIFSCDSSN